MRASPVSNRDPLSPLSLLARTLRVFPNKTAVIYGERRWTWAEFGRDIAQQAGALRRAGVGPGDRVAFLAPNVPELLAAYFSVLQLHATLVPINTRLQSEEVGYILTTRARRSSSWIRSSRRRWRASRAGSRRARGS
jgi:fatty-acyl-CoA synthase